MWSSQEPDDFSAASEGSSTSNQLRYLIKETLSTVFKAAALAFLIIYFVAQTNIVYGASMEPTLHERQRLIVEKVSYRLITPKRGDVVVVAVPDSPVPLIKRVVGLPGETVEIRDNQVLVNGRALAEPYLPPLWQVNYPPTQIPDHSVFVMGDNRPVSRDSRSFGPVAIDQIRGHAWVRYWPLTEAGIIR
ncbi:MAG: signal peptidase I [Ardenticatenaceae bacterium]|nr:signal peptidase I [Ardenticatenaceae bacterium]